MLTIAFQNIRHSKTQLLISAGGMASAVILMMTLLAIYQGAVFQFVQIVERNPAAIYIAKQGISDYFYGSSLLSADILASLQTEPDIKEVVPMISQAAVVESAGQKRDVFVFSFDPRHPEGAPWDMPKPLRQITPDEIVLSSQLAAKMRKSVGDEVTILHQKFRIVATIPDASSLGIHYAWVTLERARLMANMPDQANFAFLRLSRTEAAPEVAAHLKQRFPELTVMDKGEFLRNNKAKIDESLLPVIQAMVGIAACAGLTVISLSTYTATLERAREYGILKAIGLSHSQLYRIVLLQALVASIIGLIIGAMASWAVSQALSQWISLTPRLEWRSLLFVILLGLGTAITSSLLPLRQLVRIEPAEVFKG
jgi:putative ABC transport system permease protein